MLAQAADTLDRLSPTSTYLVVWDKLYECVHTLKGLTKLLPCAPELRDDIVELCEVVGRAYMGPFAVRDTRAAATVLREIRAALDAGARLTLLNTELATVFQREAGHEERLAAIPRPLHQISEFISKKAYEAVRLGLPMWTLEESMVLGDYMAWAKRLAETVRPNGAPHGLLIHSAPQLMSGEGTTIHAFGWVAAPEPGDTVFVERLRRALPNATIRAS